MRILFIPLILLCLTSSAQVDTPGSKTWLVGITDGNHLTRMINRSFTTFSIAIAMSEHDPWYELVKEAIFSSIINRIGFTYMYDKVFKEY